MLYAPHVSRISPQHILSALCTAFCLLFVATLTDTSLFFLHFHAIQAQPLPSSVSERTCELTVRVTHLDGTPVRNARVTVQTIRDATAYLAGLRQTDNDGTVAFDALPPGSSWILVDADQMARASAHVVLIPAPPSPQHVDVRVGPAHSLDVVVTTEDDTPLQGADVLVSCADPVGFSGKTNDKGAVSIGRLCAPPYTVHVSSNGFETAVRNDVVPQPKSHPKPVRIALRKLGWIQVSVVDQNGDPAPLSTVFVTGPTIWPARQTQSNAFGRTQISALPAGTYDLRAIRGDLASAITTGVNVERGQGTSVKLMLVASRRISVLVVSGSGEKAPPVPAASVVLAEYGLSSFPLQGTTGPDGIVQLGPIPPGPATVTARADGFVSPGAVAVEPDQTSVTIAMLQAGKLTGEVQDNRGFPVPGCSIEVIGTDIGGLPISETSSSIAFRRNHFAWALQGPPTLIPIGELGVMPGPIPPIPRPGQLDLLPQPEAIGDKNASSAQATSTASAEIPWVTDRDGRFTASPVPPGRISAIVRHPAYVEAISEAVTLRPGATAHVKVVLYAGGTVEGVVRDDKGFPVYGAIVRIMAKQGSTERTTFTDQTGAYSFSAVPSLLIITASRPESPETIAFQETLQVKDDERKQLDIELPRVRDLIELRITDDRDYPIDRVQLRALSLQNDVTLRRTTFSNAKGEATIEDAAGIRLRIEASASGYGTVVQTFDKSPNKITIKLARGIRAVGELTCRSGRDFVSNARITMYLPTGTRETQSASDGTFRADDLTPGQLRIRIEHEAFVTIEKTIDIKMPTDIYRPVQLDPIELELAGAVHGQVVDDRGNPVAGARVAKDKVPDYLPRGPLPLGVVLTDDKGEFQLPALAEGQVTLEAYAPGIGRGKRDKIDIRKERVTTDVRIEVQPDTQTNQPAVVASLAVTLAATASGTGALITHVVAGSTADQAGLAPGDLIVTIDGAKPQDERDATQRLTGPERQEVLLAILRKDNLLEIRVRREQIRQ